ncbi:hypothetical protein PAESOLCIP111_05066 [Paenibacillus solanacearum]|uniref:Luciferase domain-containing protein n=1 Tax=Paenibacillus solanacearum TaxID=2048548 RepID=A0A916NL30_9BACL|nr:luciferase family protein [Paenibacillus solanacearum]CAG7645975.1 hypothetical protein PAESOLCIP111_05066 [Paenibacillus solanacearum]
MGTLIEQLQAELLAWEGVTVCPHRFGGIEFQYRGRELGHLHGDRVADFPFPRAVRDELVASGRAHPHHRFPDSGWVTFYIRGADDAADAVALFRLQYERMHSGSTRPTAGPAEP